jgi:methylated-DNA-[protein]-cysteine S-methyltransferase
MHNAIFETELGWCAIEWRGEEISRLEFVADAAARAGQQSSNLSKAPAGLVAAIRSYCRGERESFAELALSPAGTEFQQRVWNAARKIPYGETRTYAELAAELGDANAARAVGSALGKNPALLIIPCHRVIAANGRLGGFSAPQGVALKAKLLAMEKLRALQYCA